MKSHTYDEKKVQFYLYALKFLKAQGLLQDVDRRLKSLSHMLKTTAQLIQSAKVMKSLSDESRTINENIEKIQFDLSSLNFRDLVADLIKQWNYASSLKKKERLADIEEQAERDLYINLAVRNIEDVVTDLAKDDQHFCEFCYELRQQDPKDEYTYEFLYGQVKPQVLVEIVQSNTWDPVAKEMKVSDGHCFVMANLSSE